MLVSFQAPLTLGAPAQGEGADGLLLNRAWNKWAEVYDLNGFSGHADKNDFRDLLGPLAGRSARCGWSTASRNRPKRSRPN